MSVELRPYQLKLKQDIYDGWNSGLRNVLARSPTGSGKAFTLATLTKELSHQYSMPTCVLVHRKELVEQLCMTFATLGVEHNIIAQKNTITSILYKQSKKFGRKFYNPNHIVTIVSVDTLLSRLDRYQNWLHTQRAWVLDECAHQLASNKWGKVCLAMPNAIGVGFTATPERLDKKGLGRHAFGLFDHMVHGPETRYLIGEGFLSNYKIIVPESNYRQYLQDNGDETKDYTAEARNYASMHSQITGDIVNTYIKHLYGKQNIVFVDSVEAGEMVEKNFLSNGIRAKLLTGETPPAERSQAIEAYSENQIQVLINVDLFDEGFDSLKLDTEVLTPNGWKKYNEIEKGDKCYAWDAEKEHIETVDVERVVTRTLRPNESYYSIKSQHVDISVTERHNIYYRTKDYYAKNFRSKEHSVSKIKDIFNYEKPYSIPTSSNLKWSTKMMLSDDEIRFVGWSLTDSNLSEQDSLTIYQSKPEHVIKIRELLKRLNVKHKETVTSKEVLNSHPKNYKANYDLHTFRISKKCIVYDKLFKYIKPDFSKSLHLMSKKQFEIFWETLMFADGTKQKNKSGKFCTVDKNFCDNLMQLAVLRGYTPMYGTYKTKSGKTVYNLGIKDKTYIQLTRRDERGADFTIEKGVASDLAWCITNRLGTIITRRNGKVAILGNCPSVKGLRIVEAVQMGRPTKSLGKYLQICGRALRPAYAEGYDLSTAEGRIEAQKNSYKPYGIIVDHVGNIEYHGLPCKVRRWTLDNIVRRRDGASLMRICQSITCKLPFDKTYSACPYCGCDDKPVSRVSGDGSTRKVSDMLKMVDGDMALIDPETIREMEKEMELENPYDLEARIAKLHGSGAGVNARKKQQERIEMQRELAVTIAKWCAQKQDKEHLTERRLKKLFYLKFDATIPGALSLPRAEMLAMKNEIEGDIW